MASSPITSWQIHGETVKDFIFLGSKITADGDCSHEIKTLTPWKESYDQPRHHIKKQRHYVVNKGPSCEGYGFSSNHVWMWELDYKESWAQKNWCFWTAVLEKTLKSPLDCKEIQPVHPKRNQSWVFTGRTDVETDTPIFWPPDENSWLIWKDPDAGKDWRQEKGMTEDEMAGRHHRLNGVSLNSGKPGVLRFIGSQRVGHNWAIELNWTDKEKNIRFSVSQIWVKSVFFFFGHAVQHTGL